MLRSRNNVPVFMASLMTIICAMQFQDVVAFSSRRVTNNNAAGLNTRSAPSSRLYSTRPTSIAGIDGTHSTIRNHDIIQQNEIQRRKFLNAIFTSIIALSTAPLATNAATRDPKTGILLPSIGEIESSIPTIWDDDDDPFSSFSRESFSRLDSSPDTLFYTDPRFVEHVDEQAVESMTNYISDTLLQSGDSVLDLCSSWTSHIRPSSTKVLKRVAGLGMNAKELEANTALTDWTILDLNADKNVRLPYEDGSFDVVMCQLSIDYLIHPLEVMKEASRVLKPGGKIAIIFSNGSF